MDLDDPVPLNGKVLKLHFACRANLPHGSFLRVTSSNLWGVTIQNGSVASPATLNTEGHYIEMDAEHKAIYSTSVEMVTTPEEYPLWRTRTPVICVVNEDSVDGVFQHKYRYLVVTPGAAIVDVVTETVTSDEQEGAVNVTMWEDPFEDSSHGDDTKIVKKKSLSKLPFRVVDVDLSSLDRETVKASAVSYPPSNYRWPSEEIHIDNFNNPNDPSFQVYKTTKLQIVSLNESLMEEDNGSNPEEVLKDKRIFIVCYHLPVSLSKDESTGEYTAEFTESLIAKTEHGSVTKTNETFWFGTVSTKAKNEEEREKIRKVLKPLNCTPLFLDDETVDSFYFGMCKQILWPTFHNIDLIDIAKSGWGSHNFVDEEGRLVTKVDNCWDQSRLDIWWQSFLVVNQHFSDSLMTVLKPNDVVWVHDYHLALLPKLLHEAEECLHGKRISEKVFFLHIPFPTSQVFRELERGEQILEGMLHADVVGFHAFDHARHFLNASKRILGLSHESLIGGLIGVKFRGTKVLVTISNVSIEADVVERALSSQDVQDEAERLKLIHKGRSIVSGIDIAQGLSGVSLKLLAFEKLLTDYPNWRDKVVLKQICLIPSSRKSDEADTLWHVRYLVKRIINAFGPDVIQYEECIGSSYPRERRLALWLASDVFMSVPIREGLNLLPLEYVFSRKAPGVPGVTITSEFSAVCSILNGALRVNPFDIQASSTSIDTALAMPLEQKISRRERDIQFVSSSSSGLWTRRVLGDLADVTMSTMREKKKETDKNYSSKMDSLATLSGFNISSAPLNVTAVTEAYNIAAKRVFFIDFNGTIVMKEPTGKYLKRAMLGTSEVKPPSETIDALIKLCADKRNIIYVVSGDTEQNIENAIGDIKGLGLASGNGGSLTNPTSESGRRKWTTSNLGVDWDAIKKVTLPILAKYTARANGSFVKLTSSSIGWSYYSCDPEWGSLLAESLVIELENKLQAFDVRLVTLKGVVEVVPRKLNKGLVVKEVLRRQELPDFVLCVGDDVSDEKMFTAVFSVIAQSYSAGQSIPNHAFTITVGKKVSNASYYVESAADVADLLIKLSGIDYTSGRAMSWDSEDTRQAMFES